MDNYLDNLPVFDNDTSSSEQLDLIDIDTIEQTREIDQQVTLDTIDLDLNQSGEALNDKDVSGGGSKEEPTEEQYEEEDEEIIYDESKQTYELLTKKKLYKRGASKLNKFQLDILKECAMKKSGGLSLPMGSGKTLISLVLGLGLTKKKGTGPIY